MLKTLSQNHPYNPPPKPYRRKPKSGSPPIVSYTQTKPAQLCWVPAETNSAMTILLTVRVKTFTSPGDLRFQLDNPGQVRSGMENTWNWLSTCSDQAQIRELKMY